MAWELVWEPGGVWRRFTGTVDTAEILQSIEAVQRDPRFDDLRYSLNDFLGVTNVDDVPGLLENVMAQTIGAAQTNAGIRMAIVADHPGILKRWREVPEGLIPYRVRLFERLEDARQWAGAAGR